MIRMILPEGEIICDLNDDDHFFYIMNKGKVSINIWINMNNTLIQWHTFGDMSLISEKKKKKW